MIGRAQIRFTKSHFLHEAGHDKMTAHSSRSGFPLTACVPHPLLAPALSPDHG